MTIRTNLSERLIEGRQLARRKHREGDAKKLGTLRAGNSGLMTEAGDIAGACHRLAYLRSKGIDVDEPNDSKLIMFQMGTANEDVVHHDLLHTAAPGEVILREEEIPTVWLTGNGVRVTGRPDMVVCQAPPGWEKDIDPSSGAVRNLKDLKLIFGVELKSIASVWTSRDVIGEQKPKLANLVQAAHYSWKLGVPFRLMYKQYSIQEIPNWKGKDGPGWTQKLFPQPGTVGSEHIDYDKGRIQPFEIVYELEWSGNDSSKRTEGLGLSNGAKVPTGFLRYKREGDARWSKTLIQAKDIERFYEFVSTMAEKRELGPRPLNIGPDGKKKSWNQCSYCELQSVCKQTEKKGHDVWLEAVKHYTAKQ